MTAFGNFAPFNPGSAEKQPGTSPADIGLGNTSNHKLVQQALDISPANSFPRQSAVMELPSSGYGAGPKARMDNAILKGYEVRQLPTEQGQPRETATAAKMPLTADGKPKTLGSIWPSLSVGGRATGASAADRPADLIEALSAPKSNLAVETRTATQLPPRPFTETAQPAITQLTIPARITAQAKAETGPLPAVSRVEAASWISPSAPVARGNAAAEGTRTNPSSEAARLNPTVETARVVPTVEAARVIPVVEAARVSPASPPKVYSVFNNPSPDVQNPASLDALSRQIMHTDFNARPSWPTAGKMADKADPFMAANCYQSMEFSPDGRVTTTTTLPDLSASKIESIGLDKSRTLALTDHLGRTTVKQSFDGTGQLVCQTNNRFDNPDAPMSTTERSVQTGTQTIVTTMDLSGKVVGSKILTGSTLDANTSIA
jgi:hypothetical protein